MGNMSYVRFENTSGDLADCLEHINDTNLSAREQNERQGLIELCKDIVAEADEAVEYADDNDDEDFYDD